MDLVCADWVMLVTDLIFSPGEVSLAQNNIFLLVLFFLFVLKPSVSTNFTVMVRFGVFFNSLL